MKKLPIRRWRRDAVSIARVVTSGLRGRKLCAVRVPSAMVPSSCPPASPSDRLRRSRAYIVRFAGSGFRVSTRSAASINDAAPHHRQCSMPNQRCPCQVSNQTRPHSGQRSRATKTYLLLVSKKKKKKTYLLLKQNSILVTS